jgi:predicted HAD superfamily Cof-like phosphohydrolase
MAVVLCRRSRFNPLPFMTREQLQVREFMLRAGQECPLKPKIPSKEVRELRVKLIAEELIELALAYNVNLVIVAGGVHVKAGEETGCNLVEAYDATLDLEVVVRGNGVAMGVDPEPGWEEVHRSNMTKFIDGFRREDGKWVKGPSYSPANLGPILEAQK